MKYIIIASLFLGVSISSKGQHQKKEVQFNQKLADELEKRAALDQTAAFIPKGKFKAYSPEKWRAYKDSVFTTNKLFLEEVINQYGYPGYDLVGKEGEKNYWLMVQHCDFDPQFQTSVLKKLEKQVAINNANNQNFGLLTDRVNINTGKKQVYGSQVIYVKTTGQAIPKPLIDSLNVNKRRKSVGLEPIEEYLNMMTQLHFEMNEPNMVKRGITEPKLYKVEE